MFGYGEEYIACDARIKFRKFIEGNKVDAFTTEAFGSEWNLPNSPFMTLLLDQIAKNLSTRLRIQPSYIAERLREAERNKTVLEWVELVVSENQDANIGGNHRQQYLDHLRLNDCRVVSITPTAISVFEVTFFAKSADPRAGSGGSCPPWACGAG